MPGKQDGPGPIIYGPPRAPRIAKNAHFCILWPPGPPNMKKSIFFHILGLNLKISNQIVSLFDMYIDMGERIAGKQDRPSLIIEDPLRAP